MIKFRAWGRDGNHPGTPSEKLEMFYDVSVVTTYQDGEQHVIADFGMYNESEYSGTEIIDYTLMQSTGLFDKNGVEIFEGDIVKSCRLVNGHIYEYVGQVKFVDFGWNIVDKKHTYDPFYNYTDGYPDEIWEIEVIGNIYENLDLLERVEE
ncbi:hypothetical protein SuUB92_06400 [Streptococcus uberis]|uniref:YopX family protein n=1 Tax=Streptococcus uberis TaxID=1349 RepID=UPI003365AAFA